MRIAALQHVPFEHPGLIANWARRRGHALAVTRLDLGESLPEEFDALVVMGGPMSVHDEAEYSFLPPEKALVAAAIGAGKPVLGVCLGAQMLAEVLGGRVFPNRVKEVGWAPVEGELFGLQTVFHWHGETFDLPPGARLLASSLACPNQAFAAGPALGLQFHLEMTPEIIEPLMAACAADLLAGPCAQSADEIRAGYFRVAHAEPLLDRVLDAWASGQPAANV